MQNPFHSLHAILLTLCKTKTHNTTSKMSFNTAFSKVFSQDPFVTKDDVPDSTGEPGFIYQALLPAPKSVAVLPYALPSRIPSIPMLFPSKEVDSGIRCTETPVPYYYSSKLAKGTSEADSQTMSTPDSSIDVSLSLAPTSITDMLRHDCKDSVFLRAVMARVFAQDQLAHPRAALVFVGKYVLPAVNPLLIPLTTLSASRPT